MWGDDMDTTELIKSLKVCSDFTKSCADCHYEKCDSSCLPRILVSAAERLEILSVALKIAREENTALLQEVRRRGCDSCLHKEKSATEPPCHSCLLAGGGFDNWEWRGVMPDE